MTSETPIDWTASAHVWPFDRSASTCRSFAMISSGLCLFVSILTCSPKVKSAAPGSGPLTACLAARRASYVSTAWREARVAILLPIAPDATNSAPMPSQIRRRRGVRIRTLAYLRWVGASPNLRERRCGYTVLCFPRYRRDSVLTFATMIASGREYPARDALVQSRPTSALHLTDHAPFRPPRRWLKD